MVVETFSVLIAAFSTLLGAMGLLVSRPLLERLLHVLTGRKAAHQKPYGERLAELNANLSKASREVDSILAEMAEVARNREAAVQQLEAGVQALETREKELQTTIEALEKTPLPVAERFADLVGRGEKKSRQRDYILFGAGVAVTTGIALIIQLVV